MTNPTLLDYIKTQRMQGVNDITIKNNLLSRGWSEELISESMKTSPEGMGVDVSDTEVEKKLQKLSTVSDPNTPLPLWKILIAIFGLIIIVWFVVMLSQFFPT